MEDAPQKVTSGFLARKLGLSRATVSIVLNGRGPERKITPKTVQRVLDAAREYNYVPNQTARNLRRQRSGVIGVILANFSMDWAERVMTGMLQVLDERRYCPFVATHRFDPERHRKELTAALQRRDEGVICQPLPAQNGIYREFLRAGVPLVFLGDRPVDMSEVSYAGWDSGPAARTAVQHLVDIGRKRIGHIGFDYPMRMTLARFESYRAVLREAGLPCNQQWIAMPPAGQDMRKILGAVLDRMFAPGVERPDALFVLNDGLALQTIELLDERGIRMPEDVAVIGMGDLPFTGHRAIGLSTMREPCEEMGRAAAQVMVQLIAAPKSAPLIQPIACCELKVRRTTVPQ